MNPTVANILVKPAQFVADQGVASSSSAAALCTHLEGRSLLVEARPGLARLLFSIHEGRLLVTDGGEAAPDATLTGTPLNLVRLGLGDAEQLIRDGAATVSGDAEVAADFQVLLQMLRPDLEEELAKYTGDIVAHQAGRLAKGAANWLQRAGESLGRSTAEFLSEESRDVVGAVELHEFNAAVDILSADVERAEARLNLLRQDLQSRKAASR